jgi:hypothetical protein
MKKIGKPAGLIRYGSQQTLETRTPGRLLRPRVVIYPLALGVLLSALVAFGWERKQAEVTVLRGIGAPFTLRGELVTGELRVKVRNRSDRAARYQIRIEANPALELIAPENPLEVAAGAQRTTTLFAVAPRSSFAFGRREVTVRVSGPSGLVAEVPYRLLGPTDEGSP